MAEMSDFYKKQYVELVKKIEESERPYLLKQLGMSKAKISKKLGISLLRLGKLLENRSSNIVELNRLTGIAARRDIHWPY